MPLLSLPALPTPESIIRLPLRLLIDPVTWRRRSLYCRRHGHVWSITAVEPRCVWCGITPPNSDGDDLSRK